MMVLYFDDEVYVVWNDMMMVENNFGGGEWIIGVVVEVWCYEMCEFFVGEVVGNFLNNGFVF